MQAKLLRVLQERQLRPVGADEEVSFEARVIAATNRDLPHEVDEGRFREDLFHRINVIRLRLPPLRERREDIPLLARHFLAKSARELGVETKRLSDAAVKYLAAQDLPGNVRQLENICHWLTVMAPSVAIDVKDLPPELRADAPVAAAGWVAALEKEVEGLLGRGETAVMEALVRRFEKALIVKALAHTGGRRIEASQLLGLGRNTLTRKIQELGIDSGKKGE
jgi:two-component system nitrogen regulation response regulator GlnG